MATKLNNTDTFIAKLLAPLPEAEEQVDSPRFLVSIQKDMLQAWFAGIKRIRIAEADQLLASVAFEASGERYITDVTPAALRCQAAMRRRQEAEREQCLMPAPRAVELRWKKRLMRYWRDVPADIADILARDESRLAA